MPHHMTANEVARLFGVNEVTPRRWIRADYLAATRHKQGYFRVTPAAVQAFVRRRDTWMLWRPVRLTDPALQWQAYQVRSVAGGRWYSTADVAAHTHYAQRTVQRWIDEGRLPAIQRFQYHYVWSADLAAFVPPVEAWTPEDYRAMRCKSAAQRLINQRKKAA